MFPRSLMILFIVIALTAAMPAQTKKDVRPILNPASTLKVVKVKADVSPESFSGNCPATFTFTGKITVRGKGIVRYRWLRSDGALGPIKSLRFKQSGMAKVTNQWKLGSTGQHKTGWEKLVVLAPDKMESNRAAFSMKCIRLFARARYSISGRVSGGAEGHLLRGRKVKITMTSSGGTRMHRTLTFNSSGNADYNFSGPLLGAGTYTLRIEKVPSNPDELEVTANICYDHAEPEYRRVTLSNSERHAKDQDFRVFFTIAFDRRGVCW